jgi:dolichol-phosphate mannosyltransferase
VPRLIAATDDADLVLGSRYAPGGGTRTGGLLGAFVSRGGCLYAQVLLGLRVRDLTGGFKCFRRGARGDRPRRALGPRLRVPDRDDVPHLARGAPREEVPITFVERRAGAPR